MPGNEVGQGVEGYSKFINTAEEFGSVFGPEDRAQPLRTGVTS